ncbi:MAG TPA: hypothetical protein VIL61_10645 [Nitrospiria bacterium]
MDKKLVSVERLIGLTMIIMGFLNILLSFNYDLDITPVMMFFFGVILFVHSSVETWHKWGVIGLVIAAGVLFAVDPRVAPWYKLILFYGTIVTVIVFMLTHRIKSNP